MLLRSVLLLETWELSNLARVAEFTGPNSTEWADRCSVNTYEGCCDELTSLGQIREED